MSDDADTAADDLPEHARVNRTYWDSVADQWVEMGERAWTEEPAWGIWGVPEADCPMLLDDMSGMRAIELGCGTGYVSSWMIRRGATAVGIDNSANQLATARRLADEHGVELELIHGNAETVPKPDASFDYAISEYGAAIWADPHRWIPEAWRLLKPGGQLTFLGNHPFCMTTQPRDEDVPATLNLIEPYFDMHRIEWTIPGEESVEFNLPISEWMQLFRDVGFEVLDFREPRPSSPGAEMRFFVTGDWARRFPSEQAWRLRKPA